jgi:hypothetical protein
MPKCPRCGEPLTPEELRALWGSFNGSKKSDKKAKAARENGKKHAAKFTKP